MKATPDVVIETIKELYLTLDNSGRRAFSISGIESELRRIKMNVSRATIGRAVKAHSTEWDELLQQARNSGIQKDREAEARQRGETKEEMIKDVIASDIAERRAMARQKKKAADWIIYKSLSGIIAKMQAGEDVIADLRALQQISRQEEDVIQILDGKHDTEGAHVIGRFVRQFMDIGE